MVAGPQRLAEEGTSLLCTPTPDICASNSKANISYVNRADISKILPTYQETQTLVDTHIVFVDKAATSVINSEDTEYHRKDSLTDSRVVLESRQNMIAFTDGIQYSFVQEPRYVHFLSGGKLDSNDPIIPSNIILYCRNVSYAEQLCKTDSLMDAPLAYNRYNNLAGQTVPITLKRQNSPTVSAIQPLSMYQNCATIYSGTLKVSDAGTSSSYNCSQRSMTLPKRNSELGQNSFSTVECQRKRHGHASDITGKSSYNTGSAV